MSRQGLFALLSMFAMLALGSVALAHPIEFGVMTARERADGTFDLELRFSGAESSPAGASPWLDAGCELGSIIEIPLDNGLHLRGIARCEGGLLGKRLGVRGLSGSNIEVPLTVTLANGEVQSSLLTGSEPRAVVEATPSKLEVFRRYLLLGVEHIAIGIDHLLLVLGLMLASRSTRELLVTVTSFTLGHSVTLALASLGLVVLPGPPVEACIALSLVLLAISLVRKDEAHRASPPLLALTFGLLHGFGFAGALSEIGLPGSALGLALGGFNLGVELGQLVFVALASAVSWLATRALGDARTTRILDFVPSAVGALAVYFLLERLMALGS